MKIKFLLILFFAALVALTGCKKETTLTGQMFIVTQGADNVKLGDVEILLIEKSQVADFLQKKQPTIDSEIESQQEELTNAEEKVTAALKNGENAQKDYSSLIDHPSYEKDPDYIKIKSHLATVSRLKDTFQQQYDSLDAKVTSATSDGSSDMDAFNALLTQRSSAQKSLDIENNMVTSLQAKLDDIQSRAEEEANQTFEAAQAGLTNAESDAAIAKAALKKMPTPEDYFGDFSPVFFQKTISDSDGKFSFVYPGDKSFALFARAQRMILNKTETYYWLIDAPTGSKVAQILLSNNNLVFADPDGYFKLKPKEAPQKSSEQ